MEFIAGAEWIRADFHLHTKSDTEFIYKDIENDFVKKYVQKLKEENIQLAALTNHNKFDFEQYKAIRKKASREDIYVLPGVELNINEGKAGLHALVIFNNQEWLKKRQDSINEFLIRTAPTDNHKFNFKNGRSQHNLLQTIELLNSFNKNYFIVLAHVSSDNGLLKEINGNRIEELGKSPIFRKNVLAFQSVKEGDIEKLKLWLENKLPAQIEASDPKTIEQIGKGKKSYLKLSDFNFDAVRFALQYHENRVASEIPKQENAYIKSVEYIGGKLGGKKIYLNPSMNNLIGIRGSGKSSVLETIRYALDIELPKNTESEYKSELVKTVLDDGGKMIVQMVNNQGETFIIHKTLNERTKIFKDEELKSNLKPKSIIKQALYFGQKDLSSIGNKDSIKDFISRVIGNKIIVEQQQQSEEIAYNIRKKIERIEKINIDLKKEENIKTHIAELKLKIENFKKHGIDKKLEKETIFNKDESRINHTLKVVKQKKDAFSEYLNDNDNFDSLKNYESKENQDTLNKIRVEIEKIETDVFVNLDKKLKQFEEFYKKIEDINESFIQRKENLLEEFSEIKREIKLPSDIKTDDYQKYKTNLENYELQLVELQKKSDEKAIITIELTQLLNKLKESWHKEFTLVKSEISKINNQQENVKIIPIFKGDKEHFVKHIQNFVRGSGLHTKKISNLTLQYDDFIDFYYDLKEDDKKQELEWFKQEFINNLSDFITYRVPDIFEIEYNLKPLKNHSLGQRASALIVFLLSLRNNDLIIIDQPEDDLDSQTIYNEMITILKKIKSSTQFIFVTHNPNIPVLGDCEQILACNYENEKINVEAGGIDKKNIQQKIINIMEGGIIAFEERKNKYYQWKH